MDGSKSVNPVMLPLLATRPPPTGSDTPTNTIGIVRVSRKSATLAGVEFPTSTSQRDQFSREQVRLVGTRRCKPIVNSEVAAFYPTKLPKPLPERRETGLVSGSSSGYPISIPIAGT
jgi:hypothetical protein